ncbi:hypothetical protein GCM10028778_20510 [Barrientosiimonas marina]|uniref:DUF3231 family protein n=1 Tax=Lentibacillus kimchii TaxID=1542911 RepID=A0ABW2UUF4_9BACI
METNHNTKLTSAEHSQLWIGYMQDSMSIRTLSYFLQTVEDPDIRPVIQQALDLSQAHIPKVAALFQSDNRPVPIGFSDQDVDLNAPRLFSDEFMLNNVKQTAQMGMQMYAQAIAHSARQDVRNYLSEALNESSRLYDQSLDVLLAKGIYVRAPYIDTPDQASFVNQESFMAGWFGEQRPLTALEIGNLYANIQRNSLGSHLLTGYAQTAHSKKVQDYLKRGRDIASKHVQTFTQTLQENDLPASAPWNDPVTDSTVAPFSEKLMMFQTLVTNSIGFAYYGTSASTSLRRDLPALYSRLMAEIGKYVNDGGELMIDHGWLEEPPRMIDHDELMKNKH